MDVVHNTKHTQDVSELLGALSVPLNELQRTVQMLKGETVRAFGRRVATTLTRAGGRGENVF